MSVAEKKIGEAKLAEVKEVKWLNRYQINYFLSIGF